MDDVTLREHWSNWAQKRFRQDPEAVRIALEAALTVVKAGQNGTVAAQAAEAAVLKAKRSSPAVRQASAQSPFDAVSNRLQWAQWAEREIVGDLNDIQAATEAAVCVIAKGGRPDEAIKAARDAVPDSPPGVIRGRVTHLTRYSKFLQACC
jgi:hypothetical protein